MALAKNKHLKIANGWRREVYAQYSSSTGHEHLEGVC